MTEATTTTPTAPTPEQRVAASTRMSEIAAKREAMTEAERRAYPERVRAYNEAHLEQATIAHAPEPAAPPAGPTWQERRQHREDQRALRSELTHTEEGSTAAKAVIEDTLAEQAAFDAQRPAQPKPGEITWADVPRAPSLQRWSATHKTELLQRMKLAGVSPQDAIGAGAAIQDFRELRPRPSERPPAVYDEGTRAAAERAVSRLYPSAAEREDLAADGLWNEGGERLVAALAELDRRRAAR